MHLATHVGASWAGTPCLRHLWLRYRNAYDIVDTPAMQAGGRSILDIGKQAEKRVIDVLRGKGYTVVSSPAEAAAIGLDVSPYVAPASDRKYGDDDPQFCVRSDMYPFVLGFLDGIIIDPDGKPCVLEIKTMSADKFYKCKENGICTEYPMYDAQIQIYMHFTNIRRGMFAYTPRNDAGEVDPTNPMWFHTERVVPDPHRVARMLTRIKFALDGRNIPQRPANPTACLPWCRYAALCSERDIAVDAHWPVPTCRTCSMWWGCWKSCATDLDGDFNAVCRDYVPILDILPANMRKRYLGIAHQKNDRVGLDGYLSLSGTVVPDGITRIEPRMPNRHAEEDDEGVAVCP